MRRNIVVLPKITTQDYLLDLQVQNVDSQRADRLAAWSWRKPLSEGLLPFRLVVSQTGLDGLQDSSRSLRYSETAMRGMWRPPAARQD